MKRYSLIILAGLMVYLSGCAATKVVTVPVRATGAIISAVPVVGDTADEVLDTAADAIDTLPF